jgi:hypothetical protein
MIYVLKMDNPQSPDDTGMPTRVLLVGPFLDQQAAYEWAIDVANNPFDNPCWQLVDLEKAEVESVTIS